MPTKQFTVEKIRKVGALDNPSYVIAIPKFLIKEGVFRADKKVSIIMTQEETDDGFEETNPNSDKQTTGEQTD